MSQIPGARERSCHAPEMRGWGGGRGKKPGKSLEEERFKQSIGMGFRDMPPIFSVSIHLYLFIQLSLSGDEKTLSPPL